MSIKVKAIRKGHYKYLREPNEVFEVDKKESLSSVWMERVDRKPIDKVKPKSRPKTSTKEVEEPEVEEPEVEEPEVEEPEVEEPEVEEPEVEEPKQPQTRRRRRR